MPTLRRAFPTLHDNPVATPEPNVNVRVQPIAIKLVRRPNWDALYQYNPFAKAAPVVPPQVRSSTFQPVSIFRTSFIIPGFEPWGALTTPGVSLPASAPRNDGRWFRAFVPTLSMAGGAIQRTIPRFPYVWNWPGVNTAPQSQPLTPGS